MGRFARAEKPSNRLLGCVWMYLLYKSCLTDSPCFAGEHGPGGRWKVEGGKERLAR